MLWISACYQSPTTVTPTPLPPTTPVTVPEQLPSQAATGRGGDVVRVCIDGHGFARPQPVISIFAPPRVPCGLDDNVSPLTVLRSWPLEQPIATVETFPYENVQGHFLGTDACSMLNTYADQVVPVYQAWPISWEIDSMATGWVARGLTNHRSVWCLEVSWLTTQLL